MAIAIKPITLRRRRFHRGDRNAHPRGHGELDFLSAIEMSSPRATGGLVCFGDSLTEGNLSSLDSNNRWPDQLAAPAGGAPRPRVRRDEPRHRRNRILHDMRGESALRRFDRDVLAQPGVSHVIVFIGTNDLRNQRGNPAEVVTAEQMIAGLKQFPYGQGARSHNHRARPMLPYENETITGAWTPAGEEKRQTINQWIQTSGAFDAVIDFDKALRNPAHRPACCRNTIATITCIRATKAIATWAIASI